LSAVSRDSSGVGVRGESRGVSAGVGVQGIGQPSGSCVGVVGIGLAANGFGVFSSGRTGATGTKSFVIDHPLDPENRYLMHYCSEGPDPLNVYSGTVRTDARGYANVALPSYYSSINRDARIQLTVVDEADSSDFVQAKVIRKVSKNEFRLRTSLGNVEVFWRVEAVRDDRWVRRNGAEVEPAKPEGYRGTYLQPELYGKPATYGQWRTASEAKTVSRP